MSNFAQSFHSWVTFAGCTLVVAVLYWAQPVLVPLAIAGLLTFLLAPLVTTLERGIGRPTAVVVVVTLVITVLSATTWVLAREVTLFTNELPGYRTNIREKIADIRGAGEHASLKKIESTIDDIQKNMAAGSSDRGTPARPVIVQSQPAKTSWGLPGWVGTLMQPLVTLGLVSILVVFMLVNREDLRDRLIQLFGDGQVTVTTRAFDEAASRVSRYLRMQLLTNVSYAVIAGIGLYLLGVPYAALWATLSALFRFIPYVGPWIGAGAATFVSLAAFPGWTRAFEVVAFLVALELFTNLVLETLLYAGAAGVSQVALLVAVGFWSWLWGPVGIILATPLTVCLIVLGKHVRGLEFLTTMMAERAPLSPEVGFYQRLLANDQSEASDLMERYAREHAPDEVYDALLVPALTFAERDHLSGRLSERERAAIVAFVRELAGDAQRLATPPARKPAQAGPGAQGDEPLRRPAEVPVLGIAADSSSDELTLGMLAALVAPAGAVMTISSASTMASETVTHVLERGYGLVCIADLPPSLPLKTRYLVKRLRRAAPQVRIVVGRWAPTTLREDNLQPLLDAGATAVHQTIADTARFVRDYTREAQAATTAA